jgi:hypothetical protein
LAAARDGLEDERPDPAQDEVVAPDRS